MIGASVEALSKAIWYLANKRKWQHDPPDTTLFQPEWYEIANAADFWPAHIRQQPARLPFRDVDQTRRHFSCIDGLELEICWQEQERLVTIQHLTHYIQQIVELCCAQNRVWHAALAHDGFSLHLELVVRIR